MSVESEILRIQHNIANAYAAVSEKGGDVPLQPTSANLAAAVASIPQTLPPPDNNPIGTVISYMGLTSPADYLICDGAVYNISDYPELAAFFQQQFDSANHFGGDGETTFAVPDMRNLFLRGYHGEAEEQLSGEIGAKQGATELSNIYTADYNKSIYAVSSSSDDSTAAYKNEDSIAERGDGVASITGKFNPVPNIVRYYTSRPVNMAVLYCIKAVESVPAENVYSTEETRIGTWIDGKPLYRKIFRGEISQTASINVWYTLFSIQEAETAANITGHIIQGDIHYFDIGVAWYFNQITKTFAFKNYINSGFPRASDKYEVTVEYTKTTD